MSGLQETKAGLLLAYLTTESHHRHARSSLAALIWPGVDEELARGNFRQALYQIRKRFGGISPIASDRTNAWLDVDEAWVDIWELAEQASGQAAAQSSTADVNATLNHYRGAFLAAHAADDVPVALQSWLTRRRAQFRQQAADLVQRVYADYRAAGEINRARVVLYEHLDREPLNEPVRRLLVELLNGAANQPGAGDGSGAGANGNDGGGDRNGDQGARGG